jgi:hypothetical protein
MKQAIQSNGGQTVEYTLVGEQNSITSSPSFSMIIIARLIREENIIHDK